MSDEEKIVPFVTNPLPDECVLAPDFGDATALFNSREWLTEAVKAKGAKVTGGGCGMGQADIDILLDGCEFNVSIRPIIRGDKP